MKIRTQLKAGGWSSNHNEALQVRSALKAGKLSANHCEALQIRSAIKSGGWTNNHSEVLNVRTAIKAGGWLNNHSEALKRRDDREAISMRRTLLTTSGKDDRLQLLVVRAGLRAGRRGRFGRGRK